MLGTNPSLQQLGAPLPDPIIIPPRIEICWLRHCSRPNLFTFCHKSTSPRPSPHIFNVAHRTWNSSSEKDCYLGNVQISYDASRGGVLKPSECRNMEGGNLAKSSYNFYCGLKKFNLQFILLYLRYMWERGVGWKCHMGRRGLAENVRIPSYRGEGV